MKQEKRPVRKEKELLESRRLNPLNWLVERRLKSSIVFLHKGSGNLKEIFYLKRQKYRRFLNGKFSAYRCWCSFPYYHQLYLNLYEETSEYLIQFLLLDNIFFENEEAVVKLFEGFLEQLVKAYACKIHEDFESEVN
ncbi:DUF6906 family protein [Enterococcus faecalis]|uniref:DUF6906 family protein n=1 Tax=Enterococcus faecalis TaxID=1351 RepID=UPI00338F38C3